MVIPAILSVEGDHAEVEDLQDVGCTELITDGDSQHIQLMEGALLLQRIEGGRPRSQQRLEVGCHTKDAVAVDLRDAVEQVVEDPHCVVAHPDLIEVGEADGGV